MSCPNCGRSHSESGQATMKDTIKGNQSKMAHPPTRGATRSSLCLHCGWESKWTSDGRRFVLISIKNGDSKKSMNRLRRTQA